MSSVTRYVYMNLAVVDAESESDHLRRDLRAARPRLYHTRGRRLFAGDLLEERSLRRNGPLLSDRAIIELKMLEGSVGSMVA